MRDKLLSLRHEERIKETKEEKKWEQNKVRDCSNDEIKVWVTFRLSFERLKFKYMKKSCLWLYLDSRPAATVCVWTAKPALNDNRKHDDIVGKWKNCVDK